MRVGSSEYPHGGVYIKVIKVHQHQDFYKSPMSAQYDYSLLELSSDIQFINKAQPINLPKKGDILPDGAMLEVGGWGFTEVYIKTFSKVLRRVFVPLVNQQDCGRMYTNVNYNICVLQIMRYFFFYSTKRQVMNSFLIAR